MMLHMHGNEFCHQPGSQHEGGVSARLRCGVNGLFLAWPLGFPDATGEASRTSTRLSSGMHRTAAASALQTPIVRAISRPWRCPSTMCSTGSGRSVSVGAGGAAASPLPAPAQREILVVNGAGVS